MKKLFLPKKNFELILFALTLTAMCSSCVTVNETAPQISEENSDAMEVAQVISTPNPILSIENSKSTTISIEYEEVDIQYEYINTPSMYEPENGCYSGAYIMSDKMFVGNIKSFEKYMDIENAIYSYNMRLGGVYPQSFILSCIANQKIPNISIYPPGEGDMFDEKKLIETAKAFAMFQIPMFIQFYPYSSLDGYEPKEYIDFFRLAKETFEKYAPEAAFVWNVYHEDAGSYNQFYPGDDYVDWVGISVYAKLYKNDLGEFVYRDVLNDIDMFYNTYKKQKPIMVSEFAASHYTAKNNIYYNEKAESLITAILNGLVTEYPRIKAFIYMDVNMVERNGDDNYLITDEGSIKNTYKEKLKNPYFLGSITEAELCISQTANIYNSEFKALKYEGEDYIPADCLIFDLSLSEENLNSFKDYEKIIQNKSYFPKEALKNIIGVTVKTDKNNNPLLLYKKE